MLKKILYLIALLVLFIGLFLGEIIGFFMIYGSGAGASRASDDLIMNLIFYTLPFIITGTVAYFIFRKRVKKN